MKHVKKLLVWYPLTCFQMSASVTSNGIPPMNPLRWVTPFGNEPGICHFTLGSYYLDKSCSLSRAKTLNNQLIALFFALFTNVWLSSVYEACEEVTGVVSQGAVLSWSVHLTCLSNALLVKDDMFVKDASCMLILSLLTFAHLFER